VTSLTSTLWGRRRFPAHDVMAERDGDLPGTKQAHYVPMSKLHLTDIESSPGLRR
jgi:hypothetical protein